MAASLPLLTRVAQQSPSMATKKKVVIKAFDTISLDPVKNKQLYKEAEAVDILYEGNPWFDTKSPPEFYTIEVENITKEDEKILLEEGKNSRRRVRFNESAMLALSKSNGKANMSATEARVLLIDKDAV